MPEGWGGLHEPFKHATMRSMATLPSTTRAPIVRHPNNDEHDPSAEEIRRVMSALGKRGGPKGGLARAKKLSAAQRVEIAKKAAVARWSKGGR